MGGFKEVGSVGSFGLRLIDADKGFLRDVFGEAGVAEQPTGEGKDLTAVVFV